ncbi:MAG: class I SAM-dependent RNA methyltransferase, partial [Clostridia bacterium]|nr:class I SAM-dependent RNA methyltransferase [Clostridia bacterium]
DSSGDGLHKRGYRANANEAPLKETLAAAMIKLSRYGRGIPFCDPFCGSGTIPIEAAMLAMNMAPGLNRRFAAESWGAVETSVWAEARAEALSRIDNSPFTVSGYDIDPAAAALTLENAKKAGVGTHVTASAQDIRQFSPAEPRGIIVCNPPFGERMLDIHEAEALYRVTGQVLAKFPGWNAYILSADESFETLFGRKADRRRKLYNGMIKCNCYQYYRHFQKGAPGNAQETSAPGSNAGQA